MLATEQIAHPNPTRRIALIDKAINVVRKELLRRVRIDRLSAASWQAAWDEHPELHARSNDLWLQRGLAQKERDERAYAEAMHEKRSQRLPRPKKCPTCGGATYARAA